MLSTAGISLSTYLKVIPWTVAGRVWTLTGESVDSSGWKLPRNRVIPWTVAGQTNIRITNNFTNSGFPVESTPPTKLTV